jgi:hypothetical protein
MHHFNSAKRDSAGIGEGVYFLLVTYQGHYSKLFVDDSPHSHQRTRLSCSRNGNPSLRVLSCQFDYLI